MNSYKKWKELNESFGPGFNLGLSQPQNLGLNMGQFGSVSDVAEGKKKDDDHDVEVDGEEIEAGEGCGCGAKSSKKFAKKSAKNMHSDMGGDFDDDDGEDHDDHDDEGDEGDGEEKEKGGDEGGEEEGDGDWEEKEKGGEEAEAPMFSKKKSGKKSAKKSAKKSGKKSEKKMQKESSRWEMADEESWMNSVREMLGPKKEAKYKDGWSEYQEDALIPAPATEEPKPGEPGFAPNQRLDVGFNSNVSLGEAFKVIEEACGNAGPKLQEKLIKKLARLHNSLL